MIRVPNARHMYRSSKSILLILENKIFKIIHYENTPMQSIYIDISLLLKCQFSNEELIFALNIDCGYSLLNKAVLTSMFKSKNK